MTEEDSACIREVIAVVDQDIIAFLGELIEAAELQACVF